MADGWPQFQGSAAHAGVADGPEPPYRKAWETPVDAGRGDTLSAPVVSGDTAVVVAQSSVVALDASTGELRWTVERDGDPAAPAIADDGDGDAVVVYTDGDDADAAVVALSLADGSRVWERPLEAQATSGVTVAGERAFVVDDDGMAYAIDVGSGSILWSYRVSGEVVGPPAAWDGGVFLVAAASETTASARVVGLDAATGERLWPAVIPEVTASFGSVTAVADGELIVALQDGVVYALSTEDGSISWSVRIAALVSPFSSPAVADAAAFVADRTGGIHRVGASGREWLYVFNETIVRQSPLVLGDSVVIGFEDGGVGAVDARSGRMVFRTDATGIAVMGIAVVGETLVVAHGASGVPRVVALETDPTGSLVDEASPTDVVALDLATSFGLALVLVAGVAVLGARLVRARYPIRDPSREAEPADDPTEGPA